MFIQSLNSSLLHYFAKNTRVNATVQSLQRRYQVLSIIYLNLLIILIMFLWILANIHICSRAHLTMVVASICIVVPSLWCLKNGSFVGAAVFTLLSVHFSNFFGAQFNNTSLGCTYSMVALPGITFLLSSSAKVHIFNTILSLVQNANHVKNFRAVFDVTLNEEQAFQIVQAQDLSFLNIIFMAALFSGLKAMENELWGVAQSNYTNAEDLTKETIQAVKAKDAFVSSLSHEVRNPLNSMVGSIDYLLQVVSDPAHRTVLENAKLSADVLLHLLNNVLDAAKLKSDKMELNYVEADLAGIAKKVLTIYNDSMRKKGVHSKAFIDRHLPRTLWTDSSRVLQIMMNLFSNAFKFTEAGGHVKICLTWCEENTSREELLKPLVSFAADLVLDSKIPLMSISTDMERESSRRSTLRSNRDENNLEEFNPGESLDLNESLKNLNYKSMRSISSRYQEFNERYKTIDINSVITAQRTLTQISPPSVGTCSQESKKRGFLKVQISDTGCGIDKENIPKLFDMFAQADNTIASIHGGSGLGLWICKQLCHKMGGDIAITSELSKGTTFVFYIPIVNDALVNAVYTRVISHRSQIRALVVDDYNYNRDLHKLLLEREGVQVDVANDGRGAVEKYIKNGQHFYDFILMDVQMPEMDGFEAVNKIRQHEEKNGWRITDVLFLSGEYYDEAEAIAAIRAKGKIREVSRIRTLRKPIDVKTIEGVVNNYSEQTQD